MSKVKTRDSDANTYIVIEESPNYYIVEGSPRTRYVFNKSEMTVVPERQTFTFGSWFEIGPAGNVKDSDNTLAMLASAGDGVHLVLVTPEGTHYGSAFIPDRWGAVTLEEIQQQVCERSVTAIGCPAMYVRGMRHTHCYG